MKKYKKIVYLFLIFVIFIITILIFTKVTSNEGNNAKEKGIAEIKYLENELVTLLNEMNNIETRNYNVSVSEITEQTKEQKNKSSSNSQSSESSGSESSSDNSSKQESTGEEKTEKYTLEPMGVLTNTEDIDWNNIKSEVEILYTSIPTITLDLYQLNVGQEEILKFNQEFDNMTKAVKEQNKENTLSELAKLYEYIHKFMANTTDDELEKTIVETKSNLFKAYSKLDSKNWTEIEKDTSNTISTYEKILTNTNIEASKQYLISKVYVMLNELKNAVKLQDESIFLIKYKNILEEINNL